MVVGQKLSQIIPTSPGSSSDQLVGVKSGTTDALFSLTSLAPFLPVGPTGPQGTPGLAAGWYVALSSFGVTFDGVTDDTAALNAAFASVAGTGATVVFDKTGFCKTTSTVIVGSSSHGTTSFTNIYSPFGPNNSGINYLGSPGSFAALQFQRVTFSVIEGITVRYQTGGAPGATVGIRLGGQGGADEGNACHGLIFNNVFVVQFGTGITDGNAGGASEILFNGLNLIGNTIAGFNMNSNFNSVDFTFVNLQMAGNGVGIDSGVSQGFEVFGGSSSSNTIDFQVGEENSANVSIINFRSEVAGLFVNGIGSGNTQIFGCQMFNPVGGVGTGQCIGGSFISLTVENCSIQGKVIIGEAGNLRFINNDCTNFDATSGLPFSIVPAAATCNALCQGNYNSGGLGFTFQDFDGDLSQAQTDGATALARYEPVYTRYPVQSPSFLASFGTSWLSLNHVRSLSEAGIPGGVPTGNSPTIGAGSPGQNLRVQIVFATSATAAVTFQRTVSVTTPGGGQSTELDSSAAFLPSDAGKPVVIAGHGNNSQTDWYGYISSFVTTSKVLTQSSPPQARVNTGGSVNAVIGANEPNGNYFVFITGNANETFWVDTITSSGFTVHSSNASSTATVTALIVR